MVRTLEPRTLGAIAEDLSSIARTLVSLGMEAPPGRVEDTNPVLSRVLRAASFLESAVRVLVDDEQPAPSWKASVDLRHPVEDLQGSSRAVPIQDLLSFLASSRRTGLLRVHAPGERFLVQLQEGVVVYAYGDDPPPGESLGEVLLERGAIRPEHLTRFTGSNLQRELLDPMLLQEGWLAREALESAQTVQARAAFLRLCAADEVRYWFYEGARIQTGVRVRLHTMELLLEYTRRRDEASEAARRTLRTRLRRMLASFA